MIYKSKYHIKEFHTIYMVSFENPIYIYIHICCINNWQTIIQRLIDKIHESGLYDQVLEIRVGILGDPTGYPGLTDPKIRIIYQSMDLSVGESATINLIREHSKEMQPGSRILYLHSKGVKTNGQNPCIEDWTKYMTYFTVECWRECQIELYLYDTTGVNLSQEVAWHYSGNFWWARASYISSLTECSREPYLAPEMWICSNTKNMGCLFKSHRNHYLERFPENLYRV
jgi:hypothetical protein